MTNVRRPIHLQLRPAPLAAAAAGPIVGAHQHQHLHHHHHQQQHNSSSPLGLGTPTQSIINGIPQQQQNLTHSPLPNACNSPKALSPTGDSLPSQIMPHLFVGNQEQTNRETVNRLNIKYILSLGLLPIISNSNSPTSPTIQGANQQHQQQQQSHQQILMPSQNSSKDFKIRIRSNTPNVSSSVGNCGSPQSTTTTTINSEQTVTTPSRKSTTTTTTTTAAAAAAAANNTHLHHNNHHNNHSSHHRDENKGVKTVRSIHCKCINISDNSEQLLIKFFDEAYAFIDEARRKKCNILVHCLAGISRSPTFAIAYLMRVRSLHWKDAYDLVKQCRPQIDPNLSFMGQLRIYNKSLRDELEITATNNESSHNSDTNNKLQ